MSGTHLISYIPSLYSFNIYIYLLCIGVLPTCMYVHNMHAWCQKAAEDPLQLELQEYESLREC